MSGGEYNECLNNWINCMHDSGFAVTKDSSEISVYNLSIIPVELTSFSADVDNGVVILNWGTSTETNNFGFQVERSNDRVTFDQIAFVPGFGTTTEAKTYSYRDTVLTLTSKENYYRLKQLDFNGSHTYSNIIKVDLNPPAKFVLRQNYPNPFNPSTKIRYQLPNESKVVIKIYDILGAELITLLNEEKKPGVYEIELNTQSLPSGIYIYRIIAGDFVETKKMVLMK